MTVNKMWRFVVMPVLLCIVTAVAFFSVNSEKNSCMGVKIVTEAEMSRFVSHAQKELSGWIYLDGDNAAVDAGTFTVYISQNIKENTQYNDLVGKLGINLDGHRMFFAPDEMFADLDRAVAENHPFSLIIEDNEGGYSLYSVIFTNLPVVRMNGERQYTDPDGVAVYSGDITIWDTNYAGTGGIITEKSGAEWQDSDRRDMQEAKKSWKISLANSKGGVNMLNLMGQGDDDDWVFNSLYGDSTKLREKLMASLWNGMIETASDTARMPEGEYAEIVCNGEYMGVYAVSRRTDQKYLDLDSDDILLRDKKDRRGSYVQNNYNILHGYYTEYEVWQIADGWHKNQESVVINPDKWIDANIMVNLATANGIRGYNEMYYVWHNADTKPSVDYIPVAEDAVFGIKYRRDSYRYDRDGCGAEVVYGDEYDSLKQLYPDLDERIAQRYKQLRGGILSEKAVCVLIDNANGQLAQGAALERDAERWNTEKGRDSAEELKEYIKERLEYLDRYYGI